LCQQDGAAPQELKDCMRSLDSQRLQAHDIVDQGRDEARIRECIDAMEQTSDRAKRACEKAGGVTPQLRDAVLQTHAKLSQLKHQIH
jgi:hypothetical protein